MWLPRTFGEYSSANSDQLFIASSLCKYLGSIIWYGKTLNLAYFKKFEHCSQRNEKLWCQEKKHLRHLNSMQLKCISIFLILEQLAEKERPYNFENVKHAIPAHISIVCFPLLQGYCKIKKILIASKRRQLIKHRKEGKPCLLLALMPKRNNAISLKFRSYCNGKPNLNKLWVSSSMTVLVALLWILKAIPTGTFHVAETLLIHKSLGSFYK